MLRRVLVACSCGANDFTNDSSAVKKNSATNQLNTMLQWKNGTKTIQFHTDNNNKHTVAQKVTL